jgi:hypothetical protein
MKLTCSLSTGPRSATGGLRARAAGDTAPARVYKPPLAPLPWVKPCSRRLGMSRTSTKLLREKKAEICAFIRAGGFPHVAAEAAGVPSELFHQWFAQGARARAHRDYRDFRRDVLQARAQARLNAEIKALQEKPMDWLKFGPGRETHQSPGWTSAARARTASPDTTDMLQHPEVQQLFAELVKLLKSFPEAQAALIHSLESFGFVSGAAPQRE